MLDFSSFFSAENSALLSQARHGIERETLRVDRAGNISQNSHPKEFGDKLTNPIITTDFAESQLELVTPAFATVSQSYDFLNEIHTFVAKNLPKGETIWPFSMPGIIPDDVDKISIAHYGDSDEARAKEEYRQELIKRHGKKNQLLCGIHYNFSLGSDLITALKASQNFSAEISDQQFKNQLYTHIARNFLRYRWLVVYLFGASPVFDESFVENDTEQFPKIHDRTRRCPYAISFRTSKVGYRSHAQNDLRVSYDSVTEYISDLRAATDRIAPEYVEKDLKNPYQLIEESEFYTPIRLKQIPRKNDDRLSDAIEDRGVEYIEIRAVDLNPFHPLGAGRKRYQFLHLFLLWCLLQPSPPLAPDARESANRNQAAVTLSGRRPSLELETETGEIAMTDWAEKIITEIKTIADLIDANSDEDYHAAIELQLEKIRNPEEILAERTDKFVDTKDFIAVGNELAQAHFQTLIEQKNSAEFLAKLKPYL